MENRQNDVEWEHCEGRTFCYPREGVRWWQDFNHLQTGIRQWVTGVWNLGTILGDRNDNVKWQRRGVGKWRRVEQYEVRRER